jgi:phage terminase small subunit
VVKQQDKENSERPLTPKQQRFADEYLIDLNGTRAYRTAYPKCKTDAAARAHAARLVANGNVAAYLSEAMQARAQRTEITQDRVLLELAVLGFSDLRHYVIDDNGQVTLTENAPDEAMRAISTIKRKTRTFTDRDGNTTTDRDVELRFWSKPDALKMLGQHLNMFREKDEEKAPDVGLLDKFTESVAAGGVEVTYENGLPEAEVADEC